MRERDPTNAGSDEENERGKDGGGRRKEEGRSRKITRTGVSGETRETREVRKRATPRLKLEPLR